MGWTGGPQEVDCNVIGGTAAGTAVPGAVRTHGGKLVGGALVEVLAGSSFGEPSWRSGRGVRRGSPHGGPGGELSWAGVVPWHTRGMRFRMRSRLARAGVLALATSVGLFMLAVGGHASTDELAWADGYGWTGSAGHQPWHSHYLRDASPSWGPERDLCAICLAYGNARALEAAAERSHPGDSGQRRIGARAPVRLLVRPAILPPSRAPPRG